MSSFGCGNRANRGRQAESDEQTDRIEQGMFVLGEEAQNGVGSEEQHDERED